jgi:tetratricopeptide (TPR) repeat protein
LSSSYKTIGDLTELHDRPGATEYFRKSLAALDQLSPQDRESVVALGARSSALLGLGWNLGNLGDYPASLRSLEEARRIRERMSNQDPKNVQALYFRTIPSRNLAIIHGFAGHTAESLANFLDTAAIYDRLLARSPSNPTFRFGRAEVQSSAANLAMKLGRSVEADRLANAALPVLKQIAGSPDGSDVELAIAARSLLETEVRSLRDPKLALSFALKSSRMNGKEAEIQEILAEAYWFNRDREHAVESIQKALALIEQTPTPARQNFEKTLRRYQTAKLP